MPSGLYPGNCAAEDVAEAPALSARQLDVLVLLAQGHENHAIARRLYLSDETVRTHVKAILARLGARNRTHAVGIAYRRGLLTTVLYGQPSAAAKSLPS